MYNFQTLSDPLHSSFMGRGEFVYEGEGGAIQLSSDYAFEAIWVIAPDGSIERAHLSSPELEPLQIQMPLNCRYQTVSYRMRPHMAGVLVNENLRNWRTRGNIPIDLLSGPLRRGAKLHHISEIEPFLLRLTQGLSEPDPLVRDTLAILSRRRQGRSVASSLQMLHHSHSQIARRFAASTGVSLEFYARLRRLQNAKAILSSNVEAAAIEAGFADGSHLNHECRKLTGRSFRDFVTGFTLPS